MVRLSYEELYDSYEEVLRSSLGRLACSVMIITANEVDSIASTRILTSQLRKDDIAYTVLPVSNYIDVIDIFNNNVTSDIKTIFMFNCGATYNIDRLIRSIGDDINCLIMDNHRPIHLANIYSNCVQVFDEPLQWHAFRLHCVFIF
jgi:cell division control protein 45